ncbi:uncharacterized protein SPPG_07441 [Spizellomyces punctatus DAOM BR117]|uniref:BRCT domain-containing protein n=1 Tax=Spizellomyces punctatus (strain DAOM BR117) TaxID=645134 RepID=A0A0L0H8P4_SPIPD|nr:uncharacterized protein SPPG_07441 [Spizellomyces punctatus DAOM BR117]KNC97043.1 hypothetical protein SPPG_07441 [Spizellomyces punctatus DAOM BR117]|eukprot:XP_016605083.1 hypothetical protein SPPG_07441 [Spizellomyces punctatus DAOM BR117]
MDKFVIRTKRTNTAAKDVKPATSSSAHKTPEFGGPFKIDHYQNPTAGHQVNNGGGVQRYMAARQYKLSQQKPSSVSSIFDGVHVYVNGYVGSMDDLEFRKLIQSHGGTIALTLALRTVTHMVCTSLCASKTQKLLSARRATVKVVHPDWIIQSVKSGKRLPESSFGVIKTKMVCQDVQSIFAVGQTYST